MRKPLPEDVPEELFSAAESARRTKIGGGGQFISIPGAAQVATLALLPEGVPEELHVACAGRLAVLTVRSQTVTFGGQTMSASRFEAVCGKGDAKKWKSSLWAASPEGIPLQVRGCPAVSQVH